MAGCVQHDPLNTTLGAMTAITGGAFLISPFGATAITGNIPSGRLQAGPVVGSFLSTQSFAVSGLLTNGSFGGVLRHFGILLQRVLRDIHRIGDDLIGVV